MTTERDSLESDLPEHGRMASVAGRLGYTEGQLYTAAIGLAVAVTFAVLGIPPTMDERPLTAAPVADAPLLTPVPTSPVVVVPSPVVGTPAAPVLGPRPASVPAPPQGLPLPDQPTPGPTKTAAPAAPQGVVTVFARVGNPGAPAGIALAPDGTITVSTDNSTGGPSVALVYDQRGTLLRTVAAAGQPAKRTTGIVAVATAASGRSYLLDASTNRVLQLEPDGVQLTTRATLPDVPVCLLSGVTDCESGLQDHPVQLSGVAVDERGSVFVTDAGQGIIWRLPAAGGKPHVWYGSADFSTGDGPAGLAFDKQGDLVFTAGSGIDLDNPGSGGLYRLAVTPSGEPGQRTLVHAFAAGDRPGAVAVGASGTSYVVVRGSGAIVSVDEAGLETGRLAPPGDARIPIDTPAGLALTNGRLFVTNQGSGRPAHWAVLAVAVADQP